MIFPYQHIRDDKFAPIVPLALQGVTRWIPLNAFVDSGADYSVFHSDVAAVLQLRLKAGEKKVVTVGDGDDMVVYIHPVVVRFAGQIFSVPIAFSSSLGAGFNLIGRAGFFERYQICFNDRDKIVRATRLG